MVAAHNAHLISQWFADQGFAVIVADGRGTPGRSPAWEKSVRDDLAGVTLEDQVEALHGAAPSATRWTWAGSPSAAGPTAATWPRSPCCAAPTSSTRRSSGAPVTDWRLYDTHYTERYLGHPDEQPEVVRRQLPGDRRGVVRRGGDRPGR